MSELKQFILTQVWSHVPGCRTVYACAMPEKNPITGTFGGVEWTYDRTKALLLKWGQARREASRNCAKIVEV